MTAGFRVDRAVRRRCDRPPAGAPPGVEVKVAYETSKKLGRLLAGRGKLSEFAIRKADNAAAYALAGLSYDTKFNLAEILALPWDKQFFAVPPNPGHGQMPKLGSLHSGMMKVVEAAMRTTRSSR